MKNKKLLVYNKKNSFFWKNDRNAEWAIKDKNGNWWIVPGSEFPEKKINEKDKPMPCGLPPSLNFKKIAKNLAKTILISFAIGIGLGLLGASAAVIYSLTIK